MKPSVADMLTFLEVVDARSFTAAADSLGRTRSAVSQAVQRLEEEIGVRLLYRSTRSLTLTEAGARLAGRCRDIRESYADALADLSAVSQDVAGALVVTAPHALGASVMAPAVARYLADHPSIRLRLLADDAQIDLIDAQVDLAVRVGRPKALTARIAKLGTLQESLYAHPAYIEGQGGVPSDLQALRDWRHIANDWQGTPVTYRLRPGATLAVEPQVRCNAFPEGLARATAGLGVARLPDIAVSAQRAAGDLALVAPLEQTGIYAVHHHDKRPPPKVTRFVEILRAQLRAAPARPK